MCFVVSTDFFASGPPNKPITLNVSLAGVGERHHWLWDFHQLQSVLEVVGFTGVSRWSANTGSVADFPFYPLDLDSEGRPRKGMESMYVEAFKPD